MFNENKKKTTLNFPTEEASWTPFKWLHKELTKKTASSNNNFYITGDTRSGKTKLCKDIIASTLEEGGKVLVFDRGSQYSDLCLLLGGHYEENLLDLFAVIPNGDPQDDIEQRAKEIASNLYLTQSFLRDGQKNDFSSNLTVVDVSPFHDSIAQGMMIGLLMRVAHYQKTHNASKPFVVLFEDTCLGEPSFAFPSFIETFSQTADQYGISLGRVSKTLPHVALQNKKAILEKAFWENSNWKVFFAGNNPKDFAAFSEGKLFSQGDLDSLTSFSPYSFALLGGDHPLRTYTTKLEGHHHALST